MLTKWLLGNEKNSARAGAIWNTISGTLNAGQSAIILIFISHKLGIVTAGIITIAYAVANLFLTMGKYGMRNFQVTDTNDRFLFTDYFYTRIITVTTAFLISVIYIIFCFNFADYSLSKSFLILEVVVYKLIDAFEDVYFARYQQKGRLDIGARLMVFRLSVSTVLICILVMCGLNIYFIFLAAIAVSVVIDVYFISHAKSVVEATVSTFNKKSVVTLLKTALPLCVGMTLSIYVGNAPKYMIDWYMDEETQAIFGYIMLPVFAITLLSQLLYQPVTKSLGDVWNGGKYHLFIKKVIRQYLIIAVLTFLVLIAGYFIGLPILSVLYNTDLTAYGKEFLVLLFGGGCYALAYYLNVPIVTMRKQKIIAVGYAFAAVAALVFGKFFVSNGGMFGASVLYLVINLILVFVYTLAFIININVQKRCGKENK